MNTKIIVICRTVCIYSSLVEAGPNLSKTFPIRKENTGKDAPVIAEKMWPNTNITLSAGVASDISFA